MRRHRAPAFGGCGLDLIRGFPPVCGPLWRRGFFGRRSRAPDHQQLADLLDGCTPERCADIGEHCRPCVAIVVEHAYLDELVREQRHIDFVQDGGCEAVLADRHDRMQRMRTCAQRTAE